MRMLRHLLLSLLVFVVAPTMAWAQPSQADKTTARALAMDAQKALEAGDFDIAADKFKRADDLYHAPTLSLGLARAYVGLEKYVEAMETYNRLIREPLASGASDTFKKAVEDAKTEIEGLDAKIAWATIVVTGPAEPTVTLDGEPLAVASLGVKRALNPGDHELVAEGAGYRQGSKSFSIATGETSEISLELDADPDAPAAGGDDIAEEGSILPILGWTAIAVGGAGLILGAVTGGLALGKHGDLTDACDDDSVCDPALQSDLDSFHTLGTISTIGFIAGGVLAATGVVLLIAAPSSDGDEATAARIETRIGIGHVSARLRF